MLRSMYSGISGMKVNQTKLDVVGNNVSNSGTTAFKSSRVRFQDMLSQTQSTASAPAMNTGGVNPGQVGLGVRVAGIDRIVTQGMMQPTGRKLDVAMDGDSYFVVGRGPIPINNANGVLLDTTDGSIASGNGMAVSYTRDGALALDTSGNLVTSDGYRVLGYAVREKEGDNAGTSSIDYEKNGECSFVNADSKGGLKAEETLVPLRIPDKVYVKASVVKDLDMEFTGTGDKTKIEKDGIPKVTLESGGNNKYLGSTDMKIEVKKVKDGDEYKSKVYINGLLVGTPGSSIILQKAATPPSTDEIEKNRNKLYEQLNLSDSMTVEVTDMNINGLDSKDKDAAKYSFTSVISAEGDRKVNTFVVEKDGMLKAVLEDGKVSVLGQIAMATFNNPEGLESLGKNLYQNSSNSGVALIRTGIGADYDNGKAFGDMIQGVLEMSNVDIAEQFTDMIVANRAFQASTKMISTGDEILQDIINLKR
ncbi:flagellar hook protein FlgE [Hathewaya proteolytica DSM 3090]|uniref:Flagellar hook protein FlgE n=1 Tax=Hathewaya proteolytica DSM 3090 TaxID=1121331 RepID=A0A1M6LA70_9CLOT|nr:flagellar hook-basal body complex protein [Hathewaya proteolytica]SHJ68063.1 flagellar hook protein FlgE [Hathewaya proteolytica DSM 3090]